MTCEIHRFDPGTHDAREIRKPLSQVMREAEEYRSRALAEMFAAAWRAVKRAFAASRKEPWQEKAEEDTRLAA